MKDKDFDDIGKRLYDLEADPPKNGWKKMAPAINASSGKVVWLRKHWWKPAIILIPLGAYFLYSFQTNDLPNAFYTQNSTIDKSAEAQNNPDLNEAVHGEDQTGEANAEGEVDDNASPPVKDLTSPNEKSAISKNAHDSDARSLAHEQEPPTSDKEHAFKNAESKETGAQYNPVDRRHSNDVNGASEISKAGNVALIDSDEEIPNVVSPVNTDDGSRQKQENIKTEDDTAVTLLLPSNDGIHHQSGYEPGTSPSTRETIGVNLNTPFDTANTQEAAMTPLQAETIVADSAAATKAKNDASEKLMGKWRITLSFVPQYESKLVRPIANDDVLVTGIDRSRNNHKIGFSFAAGAGLSINDNLYLDAQLSYAETQQNIYFSYATGNIDTLIAVEQPDQSVRVTPVYEISEREISSKYGYAGIRLGASHYFWSNKRRRFNISAIAGVHYLVSADVKEKRNGNWVALRNDDLNKLNYTITIGAGYNINLSRGWELMINPALTYYLRKVKNKELPYDIDQQSLGLNFMLSKTFSRK